jgi:5-methylcytosine-specific restriction protein A
MPTLPSKAPARPWLPKAPPSERKPYQRHAERTPLYDSPRWRALRLAQLKQEPCCRACAANKRVTPAVVADHITPYRDGTDFFDATNLQSLCTPCHARKSAKEGHQKAYSKRTTPQ